MATAPPKKTGSFETFPVAAKVLIVVLICGFLGGLYYVILHRSRAEDLENAQARHRQLETEYGEAERRQQEYLRVSQELAAREGIDRQNKEVLPEDAEIAAFLDDLNRVAELSGLEIQLVEPRPEESAELYTRIPVALSVRGTYHQIAKFFHNVSQLRRAINIENIHLAEPRSTEETAEVLLDVSVLASTFRRPSADEIGAAATGGAG